MSDARINQLRIKTGVLKRLVKEKMAYEKELEREQKRLEVLKEENNDQHVLNKQQEAINETIMMLPDCSRRIKAAISDLQQVVNEAQKDLNENETFQTAENLLRELVVN